MHITQYKNLDDGVIGHLKQYGYLEEDAILPLHNTLNNLEVIKAIRHYQKFFGLPITGEAGKTTIEHMEQPRCHCADVGVNSLGGVGSWPKGCHGSGEFHQFNIYFDYDSMPSFWKPVFKAAFLLVQQSYADEGISFVEVETKAKANTVVTWERGSGWIGLAIVANNPRCNTRIWAKYDNRYGSSFSQEQLINQLAMLMMHEFGHNMGMSHSRGGVMNPTLSKFKITPTTWRNDPHEPTLNRWFGGKPIPSNPIPDPIPEPDPTPIPDPTPPNPSQEITNGVVYMEDGVYQLVPSDKTITIKAQLKKLM